MTTTKIKSDLSIALMEALWDFFNRIERSVDTAAVIGEGKQIGSQVSIIYLISTRTFP